MPKARSGHLIIGTGLAVMGYAVLVIAFSRQAERIQAGSHAGASGSACAPASTLEGLPNGHAVSATTLPLGSTDARAPEAGTTALLVAEGGATDAAVAADEPSDSGAPGDARLFKFYPGGAAMSREEAQRLSSYGKLLARHPVGGVTLEAFGDTAGTDSVNAGIAKHRLKVATTLLVRAGLAEERIAATTVDVATDPRLARSVRATTAEPLPELETP